MHKSIRVKHHTNRMKNKNYYDLVDAEKAFNKI
jgi:hypothetical protein